MPTPIDRTNGELDRTILAYREDPSETNRQRALAAARRHAGNFNAELVSEYQGQTREN